MPGTERHSLSITVVDSNRRYVEVSDNFYQLVGYQREELVGKRYDDLTAPNTNDISTVFSLFQGGTETNHEVLSPMLSDEGRLPQSAR